MVIYNSELIRKRENHMLWILVAKKKICYIFSYFFRRSLCYENEVNGENASVSYMNVRHASASSAHPSFSRFEHRFLVQLFLNQLKIVLTFTPVVK